jgi:hypothetical protein
MNSSELHIVMIWSEGCYYKEKILEDLQNQVDVLDAYQISWTKKYFSRNLTRFYGENLPRFSGKERHCGNGPFITAIVRDKDPLYKQRLTTNHGIQLVNSNLFDLKNKYREWTGGGHKIHTTNTIQESRHDIMLLFGQSYNYFDNKYKSNWDGSIKLFNENLIGYDGWKNLKELFLVLNETINYVVLRNFDCLPDQNNSTMHEDIDILTDDVRNMQHILNNYSKSMLPFRVNHDIKISNNKVPFDIRFVGDKYYSDTWEKAILTNRLKNNYGIYIPDEINHFHSLLYHSLIHKTILSDEYKIILSSLSDQLGVKYKTGWEKNTLDKYMSQKEYVYTIPTDLTVYFNTDSIDINVPWNRKLFWGLIKYIRNIKAKYRKIVYLFWRVKNYILSVIWITLQKKDFISHLKTNWNITNVKEFNFSSWSSKNKHFTGQISINNKVEYLFIKYSKISHLIDTEVRIISTLRNDRGYQYDYLPEIIVQSSDGKYPFLAEKFIDGTTLGKIIGNNTKLNIDYEIFLDSIKIILTHLFKNNIIHRDITPNNIMLYSKPNEEIKIKLLDFANSLVINSNLKKLFKEDRNHFTIKYLEYLGNGFNPKPFFWDDSYSFYKIIELLTDHGNIKLEKLFSQLVYSNRKLVCDYRGLINRY